MYQTALAYDWNELQAEDCIKFYDYISDTGINDNDVVVGPVRLAKQAYGIN